MMKNFWAFMLFVVHLSLAIGQSTTNHFTVKGVSIINPLSNPSQFAPLLTNMELPKPGGNQYSDYINKQKEKSHQMFVSQQFKYRPQKTTFGTAHSPGIVRQMGMRKYIKQIDKESVYHGGIPLDNTLAFSSKYLLASVNSFLWGHDLTNDSTLFVDQNGSTSIISFAEFGKDYINDPLAESPFDPKLIYIPHYNRFVFLFLSGRKPTDSKIIIGFSSTEDPREPWYVYQIPGNPRNLDQWTDFPMTCYDSNNLYLSVNILKANTSWQLGFKGSVVWQIPLKEGFVGNHSLNTIWYDQITFNNTYIRNLTPVQNYHFSNLPEKVTFLSTRNFDIQNDSLFIVEINPTTKTFDTYVKKLPIPYGMPPNGIQADDNPNDQTDGLQTNDARFLSAISYQNSYGTKFIEFVGNTKNFANNRAAIYHGIISDSTYTLSDSFAIIAHIISVDTLDFGYPNIVHTHNGSSCYDGSFIAFNHTSATTHAGVSGIWHSHHDGYSNIIRLKEGENYVRRIQSSYERWGDYFGLQTHPNDPSILWTAGFYGTQNQSSSTWFSEIQIPDTTRLKIKIKQESRSEFVCTGDVEIIIEGGYSPFNVLWSNGSNKKNTQLNICNDYSVLITDRKNCQVTYSHSEASTQNIGYKVIYPNPVVDAVNVHFKIFKITKGSFAIYDVSGKQIISLGEHTIYPGTNAFSFTAAPLSKGVYILIIKDGDNNIIVQESFVKL